jgi:hypothetical protein
MLSGDFKPRQARKEHHSDNAKTVRNRAAEVSKTGFEAAELRARTAFRTNKSRALGRLRNSPGWNECSLKEQERREQEALNAVEKKFLDRMDDLRKEWGRKLEEDDFQSDEEPSDSAAFDMELERDVVMSDGIGSDGWEDMPDPEAMTETLTRIVKGSEAVWMKKMAKWERVAEWEAQINAEDK